jgi:uncharacterized sulfatase
MDAQSGEILRQLEEDGLADNTIVMWYSDHGVGLPRAKRWLYDSGLNIPMIVRWPGVIEPGSVSDDLVSFVDFAPTVLSLAGVKPPDYMQGQVVLGERAAPPRQYIYGMRDRMDERYDHIRAVRDRRYKYIRNYEPYRAYDQYLEYPESYPVMQDMRRAQAAGELNDVQALFFRQEKPLEELYDTDADPHELNNLAADPALADQLDRMRKALDEWEAAIGDLGAIPEFALGDWLAGETDVSDERRARIAAAKAVAVGLGSGVPRTKLASLLNDADPLVAYWGAIGLAYGPDELLTSNALEKVTGMLESDAVAHRLGAATVLVEHGRADDAIPVLRELMDDENQYVRLHAVQLLERIGPENAATLGLLEAAAEDRYMDVKKCAKHGLGK